MSHLIRSIVEHGYETSAEVVLTGGEIWTQQQETFRQESERLMEGTRLEKYVYKPQMARKLASKCESLDARAKNNEASRQSRFNKAREVFITERTNKFNWEYLDRMQDDLLRMDELKREQLERLEQLGCSTIRFAMLWCRMDMDRCEYIKEAEATSGSKSRSVRKRKRN